jgi:outer membrane protein OmpA-like peptidoglycan-associated protein
MSVQRDDTAMPATQPFTLRDYAVMIVIVAVLAFGLLLRIGPDIGGTLVAGEVTGKREAIDMPLQDTWRHLYEISYRYQQIDPRYPPIGRHQVDVALYDRLHVGSRVAVRYRRLPIVAAAFGPESAIAESSWWSRMPLPSESPRELVELVAVCVAGVLAFVAYRRDSRPLGLIATTVGVTVGSSVLLLGFLAFPLLFFAWRGNPGKGFGWVLLCSMALSTVALYERVPRPQLTASGPQGHAIGVVRSMRTVDQIWASWSPSSGESSGGQSISHPFEMVDVEFTPVARGESVHALDRVDSGSVAGLREGVSVPVTYPLSDPRAGTMAVGTRQYARRALIYVLGLTYGVGGALTIVAVLIGYALRRLAQLMGLSRIPPVALLMCAAAAAPFAAHAAAATGSKVPLREGLTVVTAYRNTSGDFEAITTVSRIDATAVTITLSTDEQADTCRDRAQSGRGRSSGLRAILRDDLEHAHALWQEFAACPSTPERHPGSTAIGVSASVLRELNAQGRTALDATTTVAGMVSGVLTRIERGTVPVSVIVNDEPIALNAVHARWQSNVGAREYWILDDVSNPLVLRGTYNGKPFVEVVKLSFPTDAAAPRIGRALEQAGRTAVYGIFFDSGSDRIKSESDPTLAEIAKVLQQNPAWAISLEGHTDNIGGDSQNLDLSKRRAAAVAQALITRYRIDGRRLQTNGYGASRPKDTNTTIEGRARNRRVELVKKN